MKPTRIKLPAPASYHITSRIKNDDFLLEGNDEKRVLLDIMRRAAEFAGIVVMSHAILDNHFHLLVHIPARQDVGDAELERRVRVLWGQEKAEERFARWRFWEVRDKAQLAEKERAALRRRMFDITPFVKTIKELFTHSHNRRHGTSGAVWGRSRFKSAAVASEFKTLATVAAYIDLNAVRAKIVRHPKNYKWCGLGAARNGDALALLGIAAMRRAAGCGAVVYGRGVEIEGGEAAFDEYLSFVDGTKKSGGSPIFKHESTSSASAKSGKNATSRAAGYARRTLDSADLTRLGAEGVARWLAENEIKPESIAEIWVRRFGNLVIGGVIGPLNAIISLNDMIYGHPTTRRRWQPGLIEEICTTIHARNETAKKRNIS
jgi:Transposase and inactivated derivatives